ncbi:MAG TPA: cytochrome c biogenesis protein CcdA [Acidimicrobiales bacterium]|nr:cytochrome c biogenesis protein CcdA [Acidimicrobiales bacterium]
MASLSPALLPLVAVLAGIISFSSPCCLPLIPGYLSYISALPHAELGRREARAVTVRAALLFVAGFAVVFTALGVSFAFVGSALLRTVPLIIRVGGLLIVAMGLAMLGVLRLPFLYRERRIDLARIPRGPRAAFGFGMAFAFGWTPCIGPVLATILAAAAATQTAAWGAFLLVCYSLGMGLPFIALAVGVQGAKGSMSWLRRNSRRIELLGGALLVGIGLLFLSGAWQSMFTPLQRYFSRFGWPPI